MASPPPTQPQRTSDIPESHPYLHEPIIWITGLPPFISDETLASALATCAPFRPNLVRDDPTRPVSGTIEFKYLERAEKALATLQGRPLPVLLPHIQLVLSPYPPTEPPTPLPPPSALPRLVKQLPPHYTDSQLFDLFRPFGALASVRTPTRFGPDTGSVEFWREEDARRAEEAMHCAEVDGSNISVQVLNQRRTASASGSVDFSPNANAPTFVPTGTIFSYPNQFPPPPTHPPPRPTPYIMRPLFVHGPGQQVQLAPPSGPGSTSHSGLIDPCNLFCKNLDPEIDSNGLFTHFRQFGQIVSARVMRNESGESRGFGFVSYQTPEQASAAMNGMNGVQLGSKQIVVRLHEPKQLRQEKLAQRFGHNGHPRSASGATSPTVSEAGESYIGWSSPRQRTSTLGSPVATQYERPERGRRGSGSYYNAALSGTLNLPMRYDELAALSPVVRKEVLTGELSRRVKSLDTVTPGEVDAVVDSIVGLSLGEVIQGIQDTGKLAEQVQTVKQTLYPPPKDSPDKSPSPAASQDSRLLDPNALNATASAPEHPSTPISVSEPLNTPPRTSSPSGSLPPTSEKERMQAAVSKLESTRQGELTELLMSLPKRERALCLFNVEILRAKLADAKVVLDSDVEEAEAPPPLVPPDSTKTTGTSPGPDPPPPAPLASSSTAGPTHTLASLAKLPAVEIIRLVNSPSTTGLPLPKPDPLVVKATDEFIDGLLDKPVPAQKQALGDKLHKVVKSFGIKGAPKITITLLDSDDLRSLAHLMNSYPAILKEKAISARENMTASK